MEYGFLGKSNMRVSKVALGTMHFGNKTEEKEAFRIMDKALDLGINFIDTANVYGGVTGKTETIIGKWLAADKTRRDKIVLASKVYSFMIRDNTNDIRKVNDVRGISKFKVKKHLEDSLSRLQTDYLDLYQVHHIDRNITMDEFFEIFEGAKAEGKMQYLGTSNYTGWALAQTQTEAKYRGSLGIVSEQSQYSLLNRYPELEVIPACDKLGIGLIPYMPLAGGLLTGKVKTEENTRTRELESDYNTKVGQNEQLKTYSKLCGELGVPEAAVAISWVLSNPVVSSAIMGIRKLSHLDVVEQAVSLKLPDDFKSELNALFNINAGKKLKDKAAPEAYAW